MKRTITTRDGIGTTAHIIQRNTLGFLRHFDQPVLIWVIKGTKHLQCNNRQYQVNAGEFLVVDGGQTIHVTNQASDTHDYEAGWITWDNALMVEHPEIFVINKPHSGCLWPIKQIPTAFQQAIKRTVQALSCPDYFPDNIAKNQITETLLWLSYQGVTFRIQETVSVSSKIRHLINTDPSENWTAPHVANIMAMSEATLRRRLNGENCSLSELLVEVRMNTALTMLQSTDRSVAQIAQDVGYSSQSKFASRFRKNFGFVPTMVREKQKRDPVTI